MCRPKCSHDENVVRAIRSSDWDAKANRWSSNLFTGPNTSVSRLKILPLRKLFGIFFKELHNPPVHKVIKAGEINVGKLHQLGQDFLVNKKPRKTTIIVEQDPVVGIPGQVDNPAHAEIPHPKLPRSLALEIIANLKMHEAPKHLALLATIRAFIAKVFSAENHRKAKKTP